MADLPLEDGLLPGEGARVVLWDRPREEYDGDALRLVDLLADGRDPGDGDRVASRDRARGMKAGDVVLVPA